MNDYKKVSFCVMPNDEVQCDILAALLCDKGYESFEQNEKGVVAYIQSELYDESEINEAISNFDFSSQINWTTEEIEGKDWNEEWEKNYFTPMVIADQCVIHSTFHKDYPKLRYDIVIDPKMAFGTGHHETTNLMVEQILNEDIKGKNVLDMGTGTGILAILAAMCGASHADGIEIDGFAYENAVENVKMNNVGNVDVFNGDASLLADKSECYDYVIANINRNIITMDIDKYAKVLRKNGKMLLSGFYEQDIPIVMQTAEKLGLKEVLHNVKKNWTMLLLTKA